jgi:hypothetical protein
VDLLTYDVARGEREYLVLEKGFEKATEARREVLARRPGKNCCDESPEQEALRPSGAGSEGRVSSPPVAREPGLRASEGPSDNLPIELSSFVGREWEVAEVSKLLGENRLLTLTGSGGCGKTRLAMAFAFRVIEDSEEGVWWVGLASLADPELVARRLPQLWRCARRRALRRSRRS